MLNYLIFAIILVLYSVHAHKALAAIAIRQITQLSEQFRLSEDVARSTCTGRMPSSAERIGGS